MNRIEQVASPTPAQQPQPRLPRVLAGVRRRAAHALLQPRESSARSRRGTTRVAVAIAALAVPMLPNSAFGAASVGGVSAGAGIGAGPIQAGPPLARHHLHHLRHGIANPEPGTMTVQEWEASGWTLTLPDHPADMGLLGHVLAMRHHGHNVPWLVEPARAPYATVPSVPAGPGVPANGRRPAIAAFRVSHTSPRADDIGVPGSQAPADRYGPFGVPNHRSADSAPPGDSSTDRFPAGAVPVRAARSRALPNPLVPAARPANTKQMLSAGRQPADVPGGVAAGQSSTPHQAVTAADSAASPCLRPANTAGKDSHMLAYLHPATDPMDVVVNHPRPACAVSVDYLTQARA